MSKPIESAEEFAVQTRNMSPEHVARLIEARDNAVRLALLDELRGWGANTDIDWWHMAHAKYGKP